jgi:DNA-binding response OmpR family regulator
MAHILIVDDLPMHLEYLTEELQNLGFKISTAADGEACLQKITKMKPDLLLLDYAMPGMDGLAVLKIIRAEEAYAGIPVILLTARKDVEDRVEGLDAGANDYITKPFHIGEVVARIRSHLWIQELQQTVVDREKRISLIQGVGQTLVTLSNHINNSTQSISGLAQLAQNEVNNAELHRQLVSVCLRHTDRIRVVLDGLHQMVEQMDLKTVDYAGTPDAMLEITELEEKLKMINSKHEEGGR